MSLEEIFMLYSIYLVNILLAFFEFVEYSTIY